jgi:hypothetical protein
MTIQSFPPTQIPEIKDDFDDFYFSKNVLGKLKTGEVYVVYAIVFLDDEGTVEDFSWRYAGWNGFTVRIDNLVSWAHIPEF